MAMMWRRGLPPLKRPQGAPPHHGRHAPRIYARSWPGLHHGPQALSTARQSTDSRRAGSRQPPDPPLLESVRSALLGDPYHYWAICRRLLTEPWEMTEPAGAAAKASNAEQRNGGGSG